MKHENIQKINTLGKAIRILSRISMVLCIVGAVSAMLVGGYIAAFGGDFIKVSGTADASISIDTDEIPFADNKYINNIIETMGDDLVISEESIEYGDIAKFNVSSIEQNGNIHTINVDGDLSVINMKKIKNEKVAEIFAGAIVLIAAAVTLGFAVRLAEAIEHCSSPFEIGIVNKMKAFGYSLIPPAALGGIANGSLLIMAILAIVVIIMIHVFSYGAKLQQESDDTV
ncbi:MAG: hypothetical protein IJX77_07560 [Ruminococcus sp.]|nr:hypothetical protein [Ruminococcus sp.]